ncbi:MAG: phage major capsid protein [Gemmatimonadota bacterium]
MQAPRGYSLPRAIARAASFETGNSLELEVHQELVRSLGNTPRGGLWVPLSAATRALNTQTPTEGAEAIFSRPQTLVDTMRARSVVATLGASVVSDMTENLALVTKTAPTPAVWVPENSLTPVADGDASFDRVVAPPRTLMASTVITMQLLKASSLSEDVASMIERDIADSFALAWDQAAISGDGAADDPVGILNRPGMQTVAIGANGGPPTWDHVVDLEAAVAEANADVEDGTLGYATTPGVRQFLKKTERFTGAGPIWDGKGMNGHPGLVSKVIPENLAKGTGSGLHALIFGRWSELVIALWNGAVELVVDPITMSRRGLVEIVGFALATVEFRHEESFSAVVDAAV